MVQNGSLERQREKFAAQFAPDGAGFVYRRFQAGAAYRVTAAERDAFVADFSRRQWRYKWSFIALLVAMMIGLVAFELMFDQDTKSDASTIGFVAALVVVGAIYVVLNMRDYTAPARSLEQRAPVADALSADERRSLGLSNLTWGKLATAAVMAGWAALRGYPFRGWNKLWLILAVAGLLVVTIQAFRKWQFDSEG